MNRILKAYSLLDIYRNVRDLLITRVFYGSGIRKLRQPVTLINRHLISFGERFSAGPNLRIEVLDPEYFGGEIRNACGTPRISIGSRVKLNNNVHIGCAYGITIGDDVLVGSNVLIIDHDHGATYNRAPEDMLLPPDARPLDGRPIHIGNSVWLSENVSVLSGTKLGDGCIAGCNSVLKGEYPPYSLIVGIPGRVIRRFNPDSGKWEDQ